MFRKVRNKVSLEVEALFLEENNKEHLYSLDFPLEGIELSSAKRERSLGIRTTFLRPLGWGRNAKILVSTEPFWSIPMSWIYFYRPIFLKEAVGLSEVQIGLLSTLLTFSSILLPLAGGYLADKFGRKRTLMLFDTISWIPSLIVWILTHNLWYAFTAYILEGLSCVIYSVWECLLVEDTVPEGRSGIYGYISLIYNLGALSTPIAGYLIGVFGVDSGIRVLFASALVSIALMIGIRQMYLRETEIGHKIMKEKIAGLEGYLSSLSIIRKNRVIMALLLSSAAASLYRSVCIYLPLFLIAENGLGLTKELASMMPSAISSSALILNLLLVPKLTTRSSYSRTLILSHLFGSLGLALLICSPRGALYSVFLSGILLGIYQVSAFSVSRTFLTNEIEVTDPKARAKILSVTITFSSLVSLPVPTLAGYLFSLEPRFPFMLASVTIMLGLILIAFATRRMK